MQRGLGRGAGPATDRPDAPETVFACLKRDYRWYWSIDERAVYLARLVRDLAMPVPQVVALLNEHRDDDENTFANALDVLVALGRTGDRHAIDGLRHYVGHGPRWPETLEKVARDWPRDHWDDLMPRAREQSRHTWAAVDEFVEALPPSPQPKPPDAERRPRRPFADRSDDELLGLLGGARSREVLFELRRREPRPELLALAPKLAAEGVGHPLGPAVERLGAAAVPLARTWAESQDPHLRWTAYRVLAGHGDAADLPLLFAGWDWLDGRPDDRCGYDTLVTGVARIGGPDARAALPRLVPLWFSPHSYERAACLRAAFALAPDLTDNQLAEGLWDCETDVRLFAATHVPLDEDTRVRLAYLRDDALEDAGVRTVADARLGT